MFIRFDRIYERVRRTDTHTDGHRMISKAATEWCAESLRLRLSASTALIIGQTSATEIHQH